MVYTPLVWPLLIGALVLAALAIYTGPFRSVPAVRPFTWLMWLGSGYALAAAVALSTADLQARIILSRIIFIYAAFAGPLFMLLVLEFIGQAHRLKRGVRALLFMIPVITILLVWTGSYHHLFYYNYWMEISRGLPVLRHDTGVWFWVHIAYSTLIISAACALLLAASPRRISWCNKLALFAGIALVSAAEMLSIAGITPVPGLNFAPLTLVLMGLLYIWAILRGRLFGIGPVSRSLLLDSLDEVVLVFDVHNRITNFNRAAEAILGLAPRLIGVHLEDLSDAWAALLLRYNSGPLRKEQITLPINGEQRLFDLVSEPMHDKRGCSTGRLFRLHDITEYHRAADALRRSQEALLHAQSVARVGSWLWHIGTNQLEWSDEMYRLFGLSQETFSGDLNDVIARAIHPNDRARVEASNQAVIEEGQPQPITYRVVWPDGSEHTLYARAGELLRNEEGVPVVLTGIAQDITERIQEEGALRESEALYRGLYEQSQAGIAVVDESDAFIGANETFCRMVGYSQAELADMLVTDIQPAEIRGVPGTVVRAELDHRQGLHETAVLHRDGRSIPADMAAGRLPDTNGRAFMIFQDITERKWNEEDQRENEERYRSLVMYSPDAIMVYQQDRVTLANHACAALFGAPSPDDLLGKSLLKLIHPDYHELIRDRMHRLREIGEPVPPVRQRIVRLNGAVVDIELSATPFMLAGEQAVHVIMRDITARIAADEALRESEERYRALLETAPVAIAVHADNRIVFCNPATLALLGAAAADELIGKPIREIVHPDSVAGAMERNRRLLAGDPSGYPVEDVYMRLDGTPVDVEVMASPLIYQGKQAVQEIASDITQRKQAEAALRESEVHFHTLANSGQALIWTSSLDKGRDYVNRPWTEFTGRALELEQGKGWLDSVHPDDRYEWLTAYNDAFGRRERFSLDFRMQRADGEYRWIQDRGSPRYNSAGEFLGYIGHCLDVTEQKQAQAALELHLQREKLMADLGRELAATLKMEEIFGIVAAGMKSMIDAPNIGIELFDAAKKVLEVAFVMTEGERIPTEEIAPLPYLPGDPANGRSQAIAAQQPVIVNDLEARRKAGVGTMIGSGDDPKCAIYVPMIAEGHVIGLLDLQSYCENAYTIEDGIWLGGVANFVGLAIQNARLYEDAQRTAVAEERNRLAGELHDAVSQTLFSSNITAESLVKLLDTRPERVKPGLVRLQQLNRGALAEMRTLLMELRPATLLKTHLKVLLNQLAAAVAGRSSVEVETDLDDVPILPPDVHIALYRITQEAINNVIKHAEASKIVVTLRSDGQTVDLSIVDDGIGFDPQLVTAEHQGLQIMRERAHKLDIDLDFSSIIDQGTTLKVHWSGETNHEETV